MRPGLDPRYGSFAAIVLALVTAAGGCRDASAPASRDRPQYFRLVSITGPGLLAGTVARGDLVLRRDSTFDFGFAGGGLASGRWTATGARLQLAPIRGGSAAATLSGDTVSVEVPTRNSLGGGGPPTVLAFARRAYPGATGFEGSRRTLRSVDGNAAGGSGGVVVYRVDAGAGRLGIGGYGLDATAAPYDTLTVSGATLIRRYAGGYARETVEERYERLP